MNQLPQHPVEQRSNRTRTGLLYGLAAYGLWGLMPVYFKAMGQVPPIDIVAHRVIWSLVVLALFLTIAKAWPAVRTAIANRKIVVTLLASALLIGINWLLFIYAVTSGHILAGSLGYYLNPLANIVLGRLILHERLSRVQWIAVAIAAIGVSVLAAEALGTLWISLGLCFSFGTYGLLRKIVAVESLPGLAIETAILAPLAIGWLMLGAAEGRPILGSNDAETWLLVSTGLVSTVPLLCFTAAARRLRYSTVGMLQFIAPTIQFLIAVAVYRETFGMAQAIAFGCIWAALIIYMTALYRNRRNPA